jgi:hypothetical protein
METALKILNRCLLIKTPGREKYCRQYDHANSSATPVRGMPPDSFYSFGSQTRTVFYKRVFPVSHKLTAHKSG